MEQIAAAERSTDRRTVGDNHRSGRSERYA